MGLRVGLRRSKFNGLVLGGSGKISGPAQRITVVETIKKLCSHAAYGKESSNTIGKEMITKAVAIVASEGICLKVYSLFISISAGLSYCWVNWNILFC